MKRYELLQVRYCANADLIWVVNGTADGEHWHPDFVSLTKGSALQWLKINDVTTWQECIVDIGKHAKIFQTEVKPPVVIDSEMQHTMSASGEALKKKKLDDAKPKEDKPIRQWINIEAAPKVNETPLKPEPVAPFDPNNPIPGKKMRIKRVNPEIQEEIELDDEPDVEPPDITLDDIAKALGIK